MQGDETLLNIFEKQFTRSLEGFIYCFIDIKPNPFAKSLFKKACPHITLKQRF